MNCGPWPVTIHKFFAEGKHYLEATLVIEIASSNAEMLDNMPLVTFKCNGIVANMERCMKFGQFLQVVASKRQSNKYVQTNTESYH